VIIGLVFEICYSNETDMKQRIGLKAQEPLENQIDNFLLQKGACCALDWGLD
jgi:hypothetical protein